MGAEHGAFAVAVDDGGTPRVVEPVPQLSLVSLHALLSPRIREWLIIDGSRVSIQGHSWTIVGWTDDALVFRYDGRST